MLIRKPVADFFLLDVPQVSLDHHARKGLRRFLTLCPEHAGGRSDMGGDALVRAAAEHGFSRSGEVPLAPGPDGRGDYGAEGRKVSSRRESRRLTVR